MNDFLSWCMHLLVPFSRCYVHTEVISTCMNMNDGSRSEYFSTSVSSTLHYIQVISLFK